MRTNFARWAALLAVPLLAACGGAVSIDEGAEGESFDATDKFLTTHAAGHKALPVNTDPSTQVWAVTAAWSDTDTTAARQAGLAWGQSSGLRWDEKFSKWVDSLPAINIENGTRTYSLTTPYGKTLRMPVLECSEQALLLRTVFASWYGLPFFVEATDGKTRIFLGHFGFRSAAGRYKGTPNFKLAYADYSARGASALTNWPHDANLRAKHLSGYDNNDFLAPGAGFGAWADEALLNKRVAYMLLFLLDWFGSMNLADSSNAYHLQPAAMRTGDFLLERWQTNGIGHTLILKDVTPLPSAQFAVELASGSMPRRAPRWDDAAWSRSYFLSEITGGVGNADDGAPYARLGGGLRRYRVAQNVSGYWVNNVPSWDVQKAIDESDLPSIAARPEQFRALLADVTPEQKLALLLSQIDQARANLQQHPASCTSRTQREAFFLELYQFAQDRLGMTRAQVDAKYRTTADYYFPELRYGASPTCCWNSTTQQMYSLVDRFNRSRESASRACLPVVAFTKANYPQFKAYAAQVGESANWTEWSEDETCAQRAVADDEKLAQVAVDYCSIRPTLEASGR